MVTSEYLTPRAIASGLNRGFLIIEDDCLEKKCSICKEFFPADKEFYHLDRGKLKSRCKPCWQDTKHHSQITNQQEEIKWVIF